MLKDLRSLRELQLLETPVSSQHIDELKQLDQLKRLVLGNAALLPANLDALREALPNCEILQY